MIALKLDACKGIAVIKMQGFPRQLPIKKTMTFSALNVFQ